MKHFAPSIAIDRLPAPVFAELAQRIGAVKAAGHDVITLGQGTPDQTTPVHILDALKEAINDASNLQYPPFRGHDFLKQAVADFYQSEFGVNIDPASEVAILLGSKAGIVALPQTIVNPGEGVIVPDPGYPDYLSGAALAGAYPITLPLLAENAFLPDYTLLDTTDVERARMLFLNYPSNPTGATATAEAFEQTVSFADANDICVVHDLAYGGISFDGPTRSFLQTEGAKDVGIELFSLSKRFNMSGFRIAFAIGNPSVIASIETYQEHLYVSAFTPIQQAATVALSSDQTCVRELSALYEARRDALFGKLQEISWDGPIPGGSFFVWLPVPSGYTSQSFTDHLLDEAHVAVTPGHFFGEYGEGYVRISLIADAERLVEAAERIGQLNLFRQTVAE
ncbi:aminotransferase class I/II-fold pyridoxal phosphate-dependent enzyme [Exiguobacterium sp. Helios]|uniref:aminotransferase class I/II-fold pyridoxal phosphate-dependent enzyme n=1 Tax=unclassified Exiguobacterium TaxID=2644629 RepID=UPI001042FA8F|nr:MULTISPECIES: aminotransferase class I/II-fold pyridoxal phosphate-dependent enzyme [unclassified Exiguobacterium]QNR22094.1 aminotransferase class I/II-fold pyridoxal phosphate-dependent enzyme [Exiguobacterium sp. Helios]